MASPSDAGKPAGRRLAPLLVFGLVLAVHLPGLGAGFVNFDDDEVLLANPRVHGLSAANLRWMFASFHHGNYMPLTWLSLAVDHELWALEPAGYHLTNVLLHATAALLVYLLIARLAALATGAPAAAVRPAAALAALWWGVHPLRVEAVAWVSERKELLCGVLLLASALAYVEAHASSRRTTLWRALSLVALALSLLSKAWGMVLPWALLVIDVYPLRRLREESRLGLLWDKLPYLMLTLPMMWVAAAAQASIGAVKGLSGHPVSLRLLEAVRNLWFYPLKGLVPWRLSPHYELDPEIGLHGSYLLAAIGLGLLLPLLLARARRWPGLAAAAVAYAILIGPLLGLVHIGSHMAADRYSYLSTIPFAVLVCWLLLRARRGAVAGAVALLIALSVLTVRQTLIWYDSERLWRHALAIEPDNHVAHANLAQALHVQGRRQAALLHYRRATERRPTYGLAWLNQGLALAALGRFAAAERSLDRAIALGEPPAVAFNARGWVRIKQGDRAGGMADLHRALDHDPRHLTARLNRAKLAEQLGWRRLARHDLRVALRVAPPREREAIRRRLRSLE